MALCFKSGMSTCWRIALFLVIPSPDSCALLRFQRAPSLSDVAASVAAQLGTLDEALPALSRLPLSSRKLKDMVAYSWSLRQAVYAFRLLLEQSSRNNRISSASPATMKTYQIAVGEFGRAGDSLRTEYVPEPRVDFGMSPAETPLRAPQPAPSPDPAATYFKKGIETTSQLGQALFELAARGSEDATNMLLQMASVPQADFDRVQMEALYLSLFTVRLIFTHATDEGSRPETEVIAEFDDTVASYFVPNPECAVLYAARSRAYSLVLGPDTPLAVALGREYSRLCSWKGSVAKATGAALVDAMIKGTKEAISAYRNADSAT